MPNKRPCPERYDAQIQFHSLGGSAKQCPNFPGTGPAQTAAEWADNKALFGQRNPLDNEVAPPLPLPLGPTTFSRWPRPPYHGEGIPLTRTGDITSTWAASILNYA